MRDLPLRLLVARWDTEAVVRIFPNPACALWPLLPKPSILLKGRAGQ